MNRHQKYMKFTIFYTPIKGRGHVHVPIAHYYVWQ